MEGFKSEEFECFLLDDNGRGSEHVSVQIGVKEGVKLCAAGTSRVLKSYKLSDVGDVSHNGTKLTLYTSEGGSIETRQVVLQGSPETMTEMYDLLLPVLLQWQEMKDSEGGSRRKQAELPKADEVEFWNKPDKTGWLSSQGDVIKTWRRRWFVLKDGYLFRFLDEASGLKAASKPRGIVDLSKINEISDGRAGCGQASSLRLATSTGASIFYMCGSETEQVEWMSALEGAHGKVMRKIAGVEEPTAAPSWEAKMQAQLPASHSNGSHSKSKHRSSSDRHAHHSSSHHSSSHHSSSSHGRSNGHRSNPPAAQGFTHGYPQMVDVVAFGGGDGGSGGGCGGGGGGGGGVFRDESIGVQYGMGSGSVVGGIAGVAGVVGRDGGYGSGGPAGAAASAPAMLDGQAMIQVIDYQSPTDRGGTGGAPAQQAHYGQPGAAGYAAGAAPAAQGYAPYAGGSLMDASPASAPAYGAPMGGYGSAPSAPSVPSAPAQAGGWTMHHAPDGKAYYHHAATGTTQWEPPVGM